jgi:quinol monooxygenase YgiN
MYSIFQHCRLSIPGVSWDNHGITHSPDAELEIDPAKLERYKAALKQEIAASIRLEPGVLSLYAVCVKGHPAQVRIFETYADQAAYEAHLQSSHSKRYKSETQHVVKSLKLIETEPILLGARTNQQ